MHPNKVVVLKRHSPRRPSRDLSTWPTMGCRAKRILGRRDRQQIHAVTMRGRNLFLSTASRRLAEAVSGMLTARATRRCGFLCFVTTIDAPAGGPLLAAWHCWHVYDRFEH